eukprot:scaffold6888_cov198-Pinguiococcus_pyrenoidosus.AAC.3
MRVADSFASPLNRMYPISAAERESLSSLGNTYISRQHRRIWQDAITKVSQIAASRTCKAE